MLTIYGQKKERGKYTRMQYDTVKTSLHSLVLTLITLKEIIFENISPFMMVSKL